MLEKKVYPQLTELAHQVQSSYAVAATAVVNVGLPVLLPLSFLNCSGCGNYGLVGTRGGHVFRYNMQSGQPRGSYPQSATPSAKTVKALMNVMKPGSIAKITSDGFSSKQIGA